MERLELQKMGIRGNTTSQLNKVLRLSPTTSLSDNVQVNFNKNDLQFLATNNFISIDKLLQNNINKGNYGTAKKIKESTVTQTISPNSCKIRQPKKSLNSLISKKENRKHECDVCRMRFTKPTFLKRHQITHTKLKLFECFECGKRFTQKSSLDRHSQTVHIGEKRYQCPKCVMKFSQKSNLVVHMKRVHDSSETATNNKYYCKDCLCVYSKLNALSRHRSRMHSTKFLKKENCKVNDQLTTNVDDDNDDETTINNVMNELRNLQTLMPSILSNLEEHSNDNETIPSLLSSSPFSFLEQLSNNDIVEKNNANINKERNCVNKNAPCILKNEMYGTVKISDISKNHTKLTHRFIKRKIIDEIKCFICLICDKKSKRYHDILRHLQTHVHHITDSSYKCPMCEKMFRLKFNLSTHMKIHEENNFSSPSKLYSCDCLEVFSSIKKYESHIRLLHCDENTLKCSICNKSLKSMSGLKTHTLSHFKNKSNECTIDKCLLEPVYVGRLRILNKDDSFSRKYQCVYCGLKFKRMYHLKLHEKTHTNRKFHMCIICEKKFISYNSLMNHRRQHFMTKTFKCNICSKCFIKKGNLKRHINLVHANEKNFKCRYCDNVYKTKEHCRRHMIIHFQKNTLNAPELGVFDDETQYQEQSNFEYNSDTTKVINTSSEARDNAVTEILSNTVKLDHINNTEDVFLSIVTNQTPSKETDCNVKIMYYDKVTENFQLSNPFENLPVQQSKTAFEQRTLLQNYGNTIDICNKIRFTCTFCNKDFQKSNDLMRHIRIHTKDKPFQCDICIASFTLKKTLQNHLKTHNKNRIYYDCQVCGRKFASIDTLKIHLRIHTGEKPYQCSFCSSCFRTTGHRTAHLKVYHKFNINNNSKFKRKV